MLSMEDSAMSRAGKGTYLTSHISCIAEPNHTVIVQYEHRFILTVKPLPLMCAYLAIEKLKLSMCIP
jgi:hypothetical protein